MQLSAPITTLLTALEAHAGRAFSRREDIGILLEVAYRQRREPDLDRLSFLAKFLVRTLGIMKRIGRDGQGYDRLIAEFGENLEKARNLMSDLLQTAPEDVRGRLQAVYLERTPAGMEHLLAWFQDLAAYKNWRIDHPGKAAWEEDTA
jgi:hypothetical protein